MSNPWRVLGVSPKSDRTAIRRAYARRLKETHPEDDPKGFEELRAAYEQALRHADYAELGPLQPASTAAEAENRAPVEAARDDGEPAVLAPVGPPVVEVPAELAAIDAAEAAHVVLLQRLVDTLRDEAALPVSRLEALEAVLHSPAMDTVTVNERTEHFLAGLIVQNAPRADDLIDRTVGHFGWADHRVGADRPLAYGVLRRREDVARLKLLRTPGANGYEAFTALSRPMTARRKLYERLTPMRAGDVRKFLEGPELSGGLETELDAGAVAWWREHLSRPRIGPLALWSVIGAAVAAILLLALMAAGARREAAGLIGVIALLGVPAVVLTARHYVIDLPRHLLERRMGWARPPWVTLGWAPMSAAIVLLSAVVPANPVATLVLAALAILALIWSLVAAGPDRSHQPGASWETWSYMSLITIGLFLTQWAWRPNMAYPWQLRAAFGFGWMAVLYLVVLNDLPQAAWAQLGVPVAAACLAVSWGLGSLIDAWRESGKRTRHLGMGIAAAVGIVGIVLSIAAPPASLGALAVALVTLLVLAHKAPARDVGDQDRVWLDLSWRYGWIAWMMVSWSFPVDAPRGLIFGCLWAAAPPLLSMAMALRREYRPESVRRSSSRQKRPVWDR